MDAQAFWAPTVSEAMKQVADELGVNAMILATEEASHPSFPTRKLFCVTAVPGLDDFEEIELGHGRNCVQNPVQNTAREESVAVPVLQKEHVSLLTGLLNQLQVLQTELKDLRNARADWERTTKLCEDLRAEVCALGRKMDSGTSGAGIEGGTESVGISRGGEEASSVADIQTTLPLWFVERPTAAVICGPVGSGKTLTTAKIAAEAVAQGKSVALVDCSGTQDLERLGNKIGVPTWNVPLEGTLEQVLSACAGLDLVLIDATEDSSEMLDEINWNEIGMDLHHLLILPATLDRDHLEIAVENAAQIDSVAVSKVDENNRNDSVLAVLKNSGYPVSHVCTGKGFPGDIRQVNLGELIAEMRAA